jgi:WD40 repeat protein
MKGPDNLGGKHKVYDIFVAFLDSADNSNTMWWNRLTSELGARDPEWQPDGTILFYRDVNARLADAFLPNYQVCTMDALGDSEVILRKDWQNMNEFLISPSMAPNGDIVFVHMEKPTGGTYRPRGIAKLNREHFMVSLDSIRVLSGKMENYISPCFSPDGKWIAYYGNSMSEPGLYISPADFSEKYLVFTPPPGTNMQTYAPSFSPDSKWLTFATRDGSVWVCDITGNGAQRLSGPGMDASPAWSKAVK